MATDRHAIPMNDGKFDNYFKNTAQLTVERTSGTPPEWPHVPKAVVDALTGGYADWYPPYAKTLKAHTPLETREKNRAKKAGTALLESFLNENIRHSSYVSEMDKESLGVFAAKPRHRIEPPRTAPVLEPHPGTPGQIVVPYRDENSEKRGKPENVHGVEVHYGIQDHEPANREELVHVVIDTNSPLYLNFGEEDRGKKVYMYGHWVIERENEKGPPGEIESCFIG